MKIVPVPEKLQRIRIKKGYSLRNLTEKTGVHSSTISLVENGKAVSPRTAKLICDGLDMDFDELFEIVNEKDFSEEKGANSCQG